MGACGSSQLQRKSDTDPAVLSAAGVDPARIHCNRENRWGATIRPDAKAGAADIMTAITPSLAPLTDDERAALTKRIDGLLMWRMVRAVLIEGDNNNFGAVPLRGYSYVDATGQSRPVLIFRTGFTPHPDSADSCFQSLLDSGVKHVVNLFDGDIPASDLVAAESAAATRAGAAYHTATDDEGGYGPWRDLLRKHYDEPDKRAQAMRSVARLINERILRPGQASPKGNIHIHCGGGMHRTGMIVGVIERCINHEDADTVELHYRRHVGWLDAAHPGGFEEGNVRFIRDFDCALLTPMTGP